MSQRAVDFDSGRAMIVTDLHGEGDVYFRLRDTFLDLHTKGEIDRFVICGDLIHGYGLEVEDSSLDMLLDMMRLQAEFGADTVTMLLGNHEMPHIYGQALAKGSIEFTPRFEAMLTRLDARDDSVYRREDIIRFLTNLPFYARTKAGVIITHAGAAPLVTTTNAAWRILNFDHDALIASADTKLAQYDITRLYMIYSAHTGALYESQARHFLAVSGPEDPRYNHLLREMVLDKSDDYKLLWDALFSLNEKGDGLPTYTQTMTDFLNAISEHSPYEQRVIVAGHISANNGYQEVGTQQLRLASYAHAQPKHTGRYLLLDCENRVAQAGNLVPHLKATPKS